MRTRYFKDLHFPLFERDSAETRAGKFQILSMGGRAEGLACASKVPRLCGTGSEDPHQH